MTLAKGWVAVAIGPALPLTPSKTFAPGSHASTFGGNPLACAAGLAVCHALMDARVLEHARKTGEYFAKKLSDCKARHRVVREVRGLGLLQGIELDMDAKTVVSECLARGILVNATGDHAAVHATSSSAGRKSIN
jgi:acetylornithine aminotransferase